MRPSISVTLEPGLERGVPWGRDLYTFVTSAAGHMMRTLQKPRKNRPSKRQVNHRRFLHNMIQRKFADIEAANHRLASALFSTEEEDKITSLPSQKPVTPDQTGSPSQDVFLHDPDKSKAQTDIDGISKSGSDLSLGSHETHEVSNKKQPDSGHLWNLRPKSRSKTCTAGKSNQSKGTHRQTHKKGSGNHKLVEVLSLSSPKHTDCYHEAELFHTENCGDENPLKATGSLSEDTLCSWAAKVKETNDAQFKHDSNSNILQSLDSSVSPSFSPELSPLSLDSCDFSIQMVAGVSTCTQAEKNIADIVESQWTDLMDLFDADDEDLGGCMDVEAYFESICACQGDGAEGTGGGEVCADDVTFMDQSESFMDKMIIRSDGDFRSEVEHPHNESGEYRYEHGYSCHGDQGLTVNHVLCDQRSSQALIPNQLSTSTSYHYDVSHLNTYQCPQQESPSMLVNCENNQHGRLFEGVAQSFCAPTQIPQHRPVPTPPHEEDWLFTDILQDRTGSHLGAS